MALRRRSIRYFGSAGRLKQGIVRLCRDLDVCSVFRFFDLAIWGSLCFNSGGESNGSVEVVRWTGFGDRVGFGGQQRGSEASSPSSCGSYGSCGSSGGSYGSWGSHGSSGGSWESGAPWLQRLDWLRRIYGSSGSSGGYGGAPAMASNSDARHGGGAVRPRHLTLSVPGDAVVYLSNQRMTLEGTVREYIVPGLKAGLQYHYPVRVDVVRDGRSSVPARTSRFRPVSN